MPKNRFFGFRGVVCGWYGASRKSGGGPWLSSLFVKLRVASLVCTLWQSLDNVVKVEVEGKQERGDLRTTTRRRSCEKKERVSLAG